MFSSIHFGQSRTAGSIHICQDQIPWLSMTWTKIPWLSRPGIQIIKFHDFPGFPGPVRTLHFINFIKKIQPISTGPNILQIRAVERRCRRHLFKFPVIRPTPFVSVSWIIRCCHLADLFVLLGVRSLANVSRARQFNPLNPPWGGVGQIFLGWEYLSAHACQI